MIISLALCLALPAVAQDEGTVRGQLVNGTPGGGSVAGQDVTLVTYLNGDMLEETVTTRTDAAGRFIFSGLKTGPEYKYDAVAFFQDVAYGSNVPGGELPAFPSGETTLEFTIDVYDTTTDDAAVFLMLSHVILNVEGDSVLVREYYVLITTDNRTFVGEEGAPGVLQFTLPEGAAGVELTYGASPDDITATEHGFWDKRPLRPGGAEVGYSYSLSLESGKTDLSRPVYYNTARLDVLVPEGSLEITGDRLVPDESMSISGSVFSHSIAEDLAAGQSLTIGVARPGGGLFGTWLILPGILVIVVVGGLFLLLRRRKLVAAPAAKGDSPRQQDLLAGLAALDDRFDAGGIDEAAYRKQRDAMKKELARLMGSRRGS
jgi:uncharacterized membrane protein